MEPLTGWSSVSLYLVPIGLVALLVDILVGLAVLWDRAKKWRFNRFSPYWRLLPQEKIKVDSNFDKAVQYHLNTIVLDFLILVPMGFFVGASLTLILEGPSYAANSIAEYEFFAFLAFQPVFGYAMYRAVKLGRAFRRFMDSLGKE